MINALGEPQRIVVLGGTSEIGLAIVERLAQRPCDICLVGRDGEALQRAAQSLEAAGHTVETMVSDAVAVDAHARTFGDLFAREVDVVIVAAGQLPQQQLHDPRADVASLEVNGVGASSWLLHAYAHMRRQGHGTIVVLSSLAVVRPRPSNFVYAAGKVMLDHLGRGLVDNAMAGVTFLLVRPGFVRTRMTHTLKRAPWSVSPDAVAVAVADRVTGPSQIVWVPEALRWLSALIARLPLRLLRRIDR